MQENSIHKEEAHRNQHWDGDYFGPNGAIAKSRQAFNLASSKKNAEEHDLNEVLRSSIGAQITLMSTIASAIGHASSQVKLGIRARPLKHILWYGWQMVKLIFELDHLTFGCTKSDMNPSHFEPGERDVLIATLLKLSPIGYVHLGFGYKHEAVKLIRYQIKNLPYDHVSSIFARARAVESQMVGYFSAGSIDNFKEDVEYAITMHAPDGKYPSLHWSDVARLARMVGNIECQRHAATMDGSSDARLKAGV